MWTSDRGRTRGCTFSTERLSPFTFVETTSETSPSLTPTPFKTRGRGVREGPGHRSPLRFPIDWGLQRKHVPFRRARFFRRPPLPSPRLLSLPTPVRLQSHYRLGPRPQVPPSGGTSPPSACTASTGATGKSRPRTRGTSSRTTGPTSVGPRLSSPRSTPTSPLLSLCGPTGVGSPLTDHSVGVDPDPLGVKSPT